MQKPNRVLFLTLNVFSATGGIEKVCRVAGKALYESGFKVNIFSMYDNTNSLDERYFPLQVFTGFAKNKLNFVLKSIREGIKNDMVILSHINLLTVGYLIKFFSPKTKLVLLAHGIEVWHPLSNVKKKMLGKCDNILAVSAFTKQKIQEINNVDERKCRVLNNCLDLYLPNQSSAAYCNKLYDRYHLAKENFILITVTRISASEQYKGHEKVIESISNVINDFPQLRYLIVGKYDLSEKERLDNLINRNNLTNKVIFAGFVPDEELSAHYQLADLYIMPSSGEGFGIVFIEAMYYCLPVIAGNTDGSVDALSNGELGLLVNPNNEEEISSAIKKVIENKAAFIPNRDLLLRKFGYPVYKNNLEQILATTYNMN